MRSICPTSPVSHVFWPDSKQAQNADWPRLIRAGEYWRIAEDSEVKPISYQHAAAAEDLLITSTLSKIFGLSWHQSTAKQTNVCVGFCARWTLVIWRRFHRRDSWVRVTASYMPLRNHITDIFRVLKSLPDKLCQCRNETLNFIFHDILQAFSNAK